MHCTLQHIQKKKTLCYSQKKRLMKPAVTTTTTQIHDTNYLNFEDIFFSTQLIMWRRKLFATVWNVFFFLFCFKTNFYESVCCYMFFLTQIHFIYLHSYTRRQFNERFWSIRPLNFFRYGLMRILSHGILHVNILRTDSLIWNIYFLKFYAFPTQKKCVILLFIQFQCTFS